jgi:hypothetical protein
MTVDDLQVTAIFMCDSRRHLQILLRGAVPFLVILGSDLDIETIGMKSEFGELVHHDTAVNTSRQEDSDTFRI